MLKSRLAATRAHISKNASWKRVLSAIVLTCSLGFLGFKVYRSWDALKAYDWRIRYVRFIPSFGLFLLQLVVITWGWQSIMHSLARPLPFRNHIRIYAYTNLMRRIPAGMLWVVVGRASGYKEQNVSVRTSALVSLLEFFLVVLTGLPLCALAGWGLGLLSSSAGLGLAAATLAMELGVIHPAVLCWLLKLARHEAPQTALTYRNTLSWAFIYTLIWLISGTGLFVIGLLFTDLPITSLPATIGVWVLSSLVSHLTLLSPSGLGVKELSLTFLLSLLLPDPLPLLIALGMRVIWTVYDVLVGTVVMAL